MHVGSSYIRAVVWGWGPSVHLLGPMVVRRRSLAVRKSGIGAVSAKEARFSLVPSMVCGIRVCRFAFHIFRFGYLGVQHP